MQTPTGTGDQTTETADGGWHGLFLGPRSLALLVLTLGVGSHAVNGFVTVAILPDIIRDLGGQERAYWIFTLFQVAAIVTGTATGALKARFGARPLFLAASATLFSGSLFSGIAEGTGWLLFGRFLQGFGEGMILALCYAVIPDLFPERLVARIFSLLAGVWAIAAGIGPLAAGILTETWSWRAAFLANLPLTGILLLCALIVLPRESRHKDGPGPRFGLAVVPRLLLIAAAVLSISMVGQMKAVPSIALALTFGLSLAVFTLRLDRKAATPFIPGAAFRPGHPLGLCMWIEILMWVSSGARVVFVTALGQAVWGLSVTKASYLATTVAFSWTVAAWLVAGVGEPARQRLLMQLGPAALTVGATLFATALSLQSMPLFALGAAFSGAGFGISNLFLNKTMIYAVQGVERDRTSAFLPTLQAAGASVGAAFAGLFGLLFGLTAAGTGELVTRETAIAAGPSVFLAMAAISLAAALLAMRLSLAAASNAEDVLSQAS
ncbi:MFS transporter [Stappia sp. F7233]|uniref:MFS transporter n=1 Tax=Stappia albiluteola TaxID=2758565 RepID=A0A839AGK2_9HYPH|nr:MFS transporter [Stappia albiluteola]MBA5777877.1 MFS transporter [Stappia albiluteola]